jgi:FAD/FMN-containing dehydrogenase
MLCSWQVLIGLILIFGLVVRNDAGCCVVGKISTSATGSQVPTSGMTRDVV